MRLAEHIYAMYTSFRHLYFESESFKLNHNIGWWVKWTDFRFHHILAWQQFSWLGAVSKSYWFHFLSLYPIHTFLKRSQASNEQNIFSLDLTDSHRHYKRISRPTRICTCKNMSHVRAWGKMNNIRSDDDWTVAFLFSTWLAIVNI